MKGGISMQLNAFAKKALSGRKRQRITVLSAAFIVYVMLLSGIFAYFHSEDTVSNRLEGKSGSVTIQEPGWDSLGHDKAKAMEPGMKIEKDPSGVNNGQVDVFIRLKMTVDLKDFDETGKTQEYIDNFKDNYDPDTNSKNAERSARRLNNILSAIKLADGTEFLNGSFTNNDNFIMDTVTDTDTGKTVYYFYYTGGDTGQKMKAVKPGESTTALFDHLYIPIFKKDYLGVFDQKFEINLTAEGIPVSAYTDKYPSGMTCDQAKGEF